MDSCVDLSRMWQFEEDAALDVAMLFCDMSLAKLEWQSVPNESGEKPGIVVHDLLLDFCRRRAEAGKKLGYWHKELLNGFLKGSNEMTAKSQRRMWRVRL